MKTISVSKAKTTLSEQLRHVQRGETVIITDRGRPVARLVPIGTTDDAVSDLERRGYARRGTRALAPAFWSAKRPADPDAAVRATVRDERDGGW